MKWLPVICILISVSCSKKVGTNPEIAFSDRALLDSARRSDYKFYQNKDTTLAPAGNSPHGPFKLRFNSTAFNALTSNGKLPVNSKFPEGSFIVKDVYKNGSINLYAWMYKRKNGWLWGEAETGGKILYSQSDPAVCVNCHSQQNNRDLTLSFIYH